MAELDLNGAIDLHVHTAPDVYPRSVDDHQLAREAQAAGMKGLVLKSHHTLTADRAWLVRQQTGFETFGGLVLNLTVGGFNLVAVETALAFGAKQIWMPTIHAQYCLQTATISMVREEARKGRSGLTVLDDEGNFRSDLLPILEMVRDADAILGTGHLAPSESLILLDQSRRMGLNKLLVTHPLMSFTRFSTDQMRQAVDFGAVLEFDALSCRPNWPEAVSPSATAQAVLEIGPAHCVLGRDGGQTATDVPGIFGAGDVVDHHYQQAATAGGMGVKAALDADDYLEDLGRAGTEGKETVEASSDD